MFTFPVFKILLLEYRSVLPPIQQYSGSRRLKVPVKCQKKIRTLLKLLEKLSTDRPTTFRMVFIFFDFVLNLSLPEILKSLIFSMPLVLQDLNINKWRKTRATPIKRHAIRKLIKCF